MTVAFKIGNVASEVGSEDFLHSFFSTISFHLEPKGWGSRFPELMNELYQGRLDPSKAGKVLGDVNTIKTELSAIAPDRVVWDIEDISAKPPWGDYVDGSVTDLSNYFITSTNRDLLGLLIECLEYQIESGQELTLETGSWMSSQAGKTRR